MAASGGSFEKVSRKPFADEEAIETWQNFVTDQQLQ
jgi:hypothetical protein